MCVCFDYVSNHSSIRLQMWRACWCRSKGEQCRVWRNFNTRHVSTLQNSTEWSSAAATAGNARWGTAELLVRAGLMLITSATARAGYARRDGPSDVVVNC